MRQNKGGGRLGKESHFRLLFDCAAMMRRGEENAADEVDSVIDKLVAMRGKRPGTLCTALTGEKELRRSFVRETMMTYTYLTEADCRMVCKRARDLLLTQPMLLELAAPIKIVGTFWRRMVFVLRSLVDLT